MSANNATLRNAIVPAIGKTARYMAASALIQNI